MKEEDFLIVSNKESIRIILMISRDMIPDSILSEKVITHFKGCCYEMLNLYNKDMLRPISKNNKRRNK